MKKILKWFDKIIRNFWVQLIALVVVSACIFLLGAFISGDRFEDKVLEILTGTDLLGVFLAALISIIVAKVLIRVKNTMEESLKLEDDHHKIISRYSGHKVIEEYPEESRFSREGELMVIDCVPQDMRRPRSMVKDRYCKEYKLREEDISDYFDRHRLRISGVDVFANVNGDTSVVFRDGGHHTREPRLRRLLRRDGIQRARLPARSRARDGISLRPPAKSAGASRPRPS